MRVAVVHDYLTQRGGAERVARALLRTFPGAPLYTSLYDADLTFPEFREADVRTLPIDRVPLLRRHHRLALPVLAPSFSTLRIDADVIICSSSGWAHGARTTGRKIVYCHTPARWLYQPDRYLGERNRLPAAALSLLRRPLVRWDHAAAASADRYIANSHAVRDRVRDVYGRDADVVPPPFAVDPALPRRAPSGIEPGYVLCVSRLLPYKNVAPLVEAFAHLGTERLVVAGDGPDAARLRAGATANVRLLGIVGDEELRWLYANASLLAAPAYEDFGLTPLEAAAFGKPTVALRFGGYLDTVAEGRTGALFDEPDATSIAAAIRDALGRSWDPAEIRAHAAGFSEERFAERIRAIAAEVAGHSSQYA